MTVGIQNTEGIMRLWQHRKTHDHLPMIMKDMAPSNNRLQERRRCRATICHCHFLYPLTIFCRVTLNITASKILGICESDWGNLLWNFQRPQNPGSRTPMSGFRNIFRTIFCDYNENLSISFAILSGLYSAVVPHSEPRKHLTVMSLDFIRSENV